MIIGESHNWSANLAVPMSDWNYQVSCCRDGIIALRVLESVNILVTSIVAALGLQILRKTKILHINLRMLVVAYLVNDLTLLYVRILDILNVSGLLDEHPDLQLLRISSWMFGMIMPLTIVLERIYATRNHTTYENALLYYARYTRKHANRIMEMRFRLMTNNVANRYQVIEAQRCSHMLKWYIPYQAVMTISTIASAIAIRALVLTESAAFY
ncbi:hypothetical protein PENTCL1PPCAC_16632, partial [Pristionchus entomophagus]